MELYYLHNGITPIGPFSLEELRIRNINKELSVWRDGLTDWMPAGELDELKDFFIVAPPPFKASKSEEKPPAKALNDDPTRSPSGITRIVYWAIGGAAAILLSE